MLIEILKSIVIVRVLGGGFMKSLFGKVIGVIAGVAALFGISVANVTAAVPDISNKSALYLEHGKHIGSSIVVYDHESHASHASHSSHRSHYSGY